MERSGAVSLSDHGRKEARECVEGTAGRDSPDGNEKTVAYLSGPRLRGPGFLGAAFLVNLRWPSIGLETLIENFFCGFLPTGFDDAVVARRGPGLAPAPGL